MTHFEKSTKTHPLIGNLNSRTSQTTAVNTAVFATTFVLKCTTASYKTTAIYAIELIKHLKLWLNT